MTTPQVQLMLDSGAYSAWSRGVAVDIKEYIRYIKLHQPLLSSYASLDVIPGQDGKRSNSPTAIEAAAKQSHDNLHRMQDAGLSPIPVFHVGEQFDWLHRLLEAKEPYIALGGMVGARSDKKLLVSWIEKCFSIIGTRTKVHGFGQTSPHILLRFPWYSADSTSWCIGGGFGLIMVPAWHRGRFDFSLKPAKLSLTSEKMKSSRKHFDGLGKLEATAIVKFLEAAGLTLEAVRNDHRQRKKLMAIYYQLLGRYKEKVDGRPFRMVFATTPHVRQQGENLTEISAQHRLMSYFELKLMSEGWLERYVNEGFVGVERPHTKWSDSQYVVIRRLGLVARRGLHNADETY